MADSQRKSGRLFRLGSKEDCSSLVSKDDIPGPPVTSPPITTMKMKKSAIPGPPSGAPPKRQPAPPAPSKPMPSIDPPKRSLPQSPSLPPSKALPSPKRPLPKRMSNPTVGLKLPPKTNLNRAASTGSLTQSPKNKRPPKRKSNSPGLNLPSGSRPSLGRSASAYSMNKPPKRPSNSPGGLKMPPRGNLVRAKSTSSMSKPPQRQIYKSWTEPPAETPAIVYDSSENLPTTIPESPASRSLRNSIRKPRKKASYAELPTPMSLKLGSNVSTMSIELLGAEVEVINLETDEACYRYIALEVIGVDPSMKCLTNVNVVDNTRRVLDSYDYGSVLGIDKWEIKKIAGRRVAVANTVDCEHNGRIELWKESEGGRAQQVTLSTSTWINSKFIIYDSKKRKQAFGSWILEEEVGMESHGINSMLFTLGDDEKGFVEYEIKFVSEAHYLSFYYLLSENRDLGNDERMNRLLARFSTDDLDEVYDKVVISRTRPRDRDGLRSVEFDVKYQNILEVDERMAITDLEDVIKEFAEADSMNICESLCELRGWLQDSESIHVQDFIQQMGLVRILEKTEECRSEPEDHLWEIYQCALECYEAVLQKEETGNMECSPILLLIENHDILFFIFTCLDHNDVNVRSSVINITFGLFHITKSLLEEGKEQVAEDAFIAVYQALLEYAQGNQHQNIWWVYVDQLDKVIQQPEVTSEDLEYAIRISYSINSLLDNPHMQYVNRLEARACLSYLGYWDFHNELKQRFEEAGFDQQKIDDFNEQIEYYDQCNDADQDAMPEMDECFEKLKQRCDNNGTAHDFARVMQYLIMIPNDSDTQLWDYAVDSLGATIILKESREDYHRIQEEYEGQLEELQKQKEELNAQLKKQKEQNAYLKKMSRSRAPQKALPGIVKKLDPALKPYLEMHEKKIPRSQIEEKMKADKIDPKRFVEILRFGIPGPPPPAARPKPELPADLLKYYKMLKVRMPEQSVINRMRQDKVDPSRLEEVTRYIKALKDWESGASAAPPGPPPAAAPSIDPALNKYVKMLKMGVPPPSIKNKMTQDKVDRERFAEVEAFVNGKPMKPKSGTVLSLEAPKKKKPLAPELQKYFKLYSKFRAPRNNVENKMKQDGMDPKRFEEILEFLGEKPVAEVKKKEQKPKKKKGLFGLKLLKSEFFQNIFKRTKSEQVLDDEDLVFLTTAPKKKEVKEKVKKKKKPKNVCLVHHPKKKQTMDFMCAQLQREHITNKDIVDAFWQLNDTKIPELDKFINILPTEEEMVLVRDFKGEVAALDKPSQLYYDLRGVPNILMRAQLWYFSENADDQIIAAKMAMEKVQTACDAVLSDEGLKKMFSAILQLLQKVNPEKYEYGFQLSQLFVIAKKKTSDGKTTWLMHLCKKFLERDPEVLNYVQSLNKMNECLKYSDISKVQLDIVKLANACKRMTNAVKTYPKESAREDCYFERYFTWSQEYLQGEIDQLEQDHKKLDETCRAMCRQFGEDEQGSKGKRSVNTSFFSTLGQFGNDTKYAMGELEKLKEMAKRQERKKKEKLRKEALKEKRRARRRKKAEDEEKARKMDKSRSVNQKLRGDLTDIIKLEMKKDALPTKMPTVPEKASTQLFDQDNLINKKPKINSVPPRRAARIMSIEKDNERDISRKSSTLNRSDAKSKNIILTRVRGDSSSNMFAAQGRSSSRRRSVLTAKNRPLMQAAPRKPLPNIRRRVGGTKSSLPPSRKAPMRPRKSLLGGTKTDPFALDGLEEIVDVYEKGDDI